MSEILIPILAPCEMARNCSYSCMASSRVGVSTTEWPPTGSLSRECRMGSAKHSVLPVPVGEPPMRSEPERIVGMVRD